MKGKIFAVIMCILVVSLIASPLCSKTFAVGGGAMTSLYVHDDLRVPTLYNCLTGSNKTAIVAGKNWIANIFKDADCDIYVYVGNPYNPAYVQPALPDGYILGGVRHPLDDALPRFYIPKGTEDPPGLPGQYNSTLSWAWSTTIFPSDKWIVDQALNVVKNDDPDFMYIILANMDEGGHMYGNFQDEGKPNLNNAVNYDAMKDQLSITDAEVGRFIQNISGENKLADSLIIVTADHGMSTMKNALKAVDLRGILKSNGINMRAWDRTPTGQYNASGDYDWIMSEGPIAYIYNVDPTKIAGIESVLESYDLGLGEKPIYNVLNKAEQEARNMFCPNYRSVVWPSLIVLMQPNYMCPVYYDELVVGVNAFMAEFTVPQVGFGNIPTIMGAHGTVSEQNVPLIINGSGVSVGVNTTDVSTLDIVPTICYMNRWNTLPNPAGTALTDVGTPPATRAKRTYVIVLDGMRGDYYNYDSRTPNLADLASHGWRFTNCNDTLVGLTGTNHAGIITSAPQGTHGILGVGAYFIGLESGVGGFQIPLDTITLLAPYICLASVITIVSVGSVILAKRRKKIQ